MPAGCHHPHPRRRRGCRRRRARRVLRPAGGGGRRKREERETSTYGVRNGKCLPENVCEKCLREINVCLQAEEGGVEGPGAGQGEQGHPCAPPTHHTHTPTHPHTLEFRISHHAKGQQGHPCAPRPPPPPPPGITSNNSMVSRVRYLSSRTGRAGPLLRPPTNTNTTGNNFQ